MGVRARGGSAGGWECVSVVILNYSVQLSPAEKLSPSSTCTVRVVTELKKVPHRTNSETKRVVFCSVLWSVRLYVRVVTWDNA